MELSQLHYFRTVARLEHITQAANVLHLSQPALSRAIARLEAEVGVKLFERDGNRISLNSAGAAYLKRVDNAVAELENGLNELMSLSGQPHGTVTFSSFTAGMLSQPIREYLLSNPNVNICHLIQSPQQMEHSLELGEVDFAFSLTPIESPNIVWTPVAEDELIVLVSDAHPLAARGRIALDELAGERLAVADSGLGLRQLVEHFCFLSGFTPRFIYQGTEGNLIMSLLRQNTCVFVIPASAHTWKMEDDRLQYDYDPPKPPFATLRISSPDCRFAYGVSTLKGKTLSSAAQEFYQSVLDYLSRSSDRAEPL